MAYGNNQKLCLKLSKEAEINSIFENFRIAPRSHLLLPPPVLDARL